MIRISRPSPSFVLSCIALFVALSGSAIALQGQNGVKSDDIAPGAVHRGDVANNAINSAKVANNSITGNDVNESTLDGSQIPGNPTGGGSTPTGPAGGDLAGTYPNPTIADNAVTTSKLAPGAVTSAKLGSASVTNAKVAANAIAWADIQSGAVRADTLGTLTVRINSASIGAGAFAAVSSSCQAGERAISGGGGTGGTSTFMTDSRPIFSGGVNPTCWTVGFKATGGSDTGQTFVLCLQT